MSIASSCIWSAGGEQQQQQQQQQQQVVDGHRRRVYTTTIKTGDRAFAGTDSAAQIDLINEDGLEWRMDLGDGNFTTGSSVTFAIDQDLGFGIVDALNLYTLNGTLIGASWFVETVTITYEVTAFVTANGEPVVINEDDNEFGGKNAAALSSAAKIQLTERFDVGEWIENYTWSGKKTHVHEKRQELNHLETANTDREKNQQQQMQHHQQEPYQSRASNGSNKRANPKPNNTQCGASDTVLSAKTHHHGGWWRKRKEIDVIVPETDGKDENDDIFASKSFAEELRDAYRALNLSDALDTAAGEDDIDGHFHRYLLRLVDRLTHDENVTAATPKE